MLIKIKFDCLLIYKKKIQLYLYKKGLVYWSLYKVMKEYSWNNYNKIEGFLIIKERIINIKLFNIIYKLNMKIYINNV
jgi:hypothetical protein